MSNVTASRMLLKFLTVNWHNILFTSIYPNFLPLSLLYPAFLFLQQFYEIDSHILGCSFTLGIIFTPYTDYPLFNHFLNIRFYHYLHQPSFSPVARNPTSPYQKSACRTPQQADSGSISYVSISLWLPFPHGYGVPTY